MVKASEELGFTKCKNEGGRGMICKETLSFSNEEYAVQEKRKKIVQFNGGPGEDGTEE